jgi:hypothetical protein
MKTLPCLYYFELQYFAYIGLMQQNKQVSVEVIMMDLNTFLWKFILTAVAFQTVSSVLPQRFVPPDGSGNL